MEIDTTEGTYSFTFSGIAEAHKFASLAEDGATGTTLAQRMASKATAALDLADSVLGVNARETVKNALEQGLSGNIPGIFNKKN